MMLKLITLLGLGALILAPAALASQATAADDKAANPLVRKAPENAQLYFISPQDGQTLKSPFKVVFGLKNMGVAPAGVDKENTGHHHLLINLEQLPNLELPLPSTDQVRHFGGGQTETEIILPPGKHSLQLLLGNYLHVPHQQPVISEKIQITVEQ